MLYRVPMEEGIWPECLTALCTQLKALQCFYIVAGAGAAPGIRAHGGLPFDPGAQRLYNERHQGFDPYAIAFPRKPRLGPIVAEELVDRTELEHSEFYHELKGTGMHHALFLPVVLTRTRVELITIWRAGDQEPFDAESIELTELILPHLQSVLQAQHALAASIRRARRAELALDAVAEPACILNASGRVHHYNLAAEALLRAGDGLTMSEKRLCASDPHTDSRLQGLIRSAASVSAATLTQPGGVIALPRPSGRRALQVVVLPLRLSGSTSPPHVLLRVGDPDRTAHTPRGVLSALYGLTAAEAEISNALLTGHSIEQIADLRQVTSGTLRAQMNSIFRKTDTRRQSGLLKLLMSLPALDTNRTR